MNPDIIGAVITAIIGTLIAFVNYVFSKRVLTKAPEKYSFTTVVRQVLQIGFLALVYFAGTKLTDADPVYLLVGAVLGLTLPMFYFTKKLLSLNETMTSKEKGKEDTEDG